MVARHHGILFYSIGNSTRVRARRSFRFPAGTIFAAALQPAESVAGISVGFLPSAGRNGEAAFPCVEAAGGSIAGLANARFARPIVLNAPARPGPAGPVRIAAFRDMAKSAFSGVFIAKAAAPKMRMRNDHAGRLLNRS